MADLTGNALVVQCGGTTAVMNSSVSGVIEEAMEHEAIEEIYGAVNGAVGLLREELIDLSHEKKKTIEGLRRTPAAALGTCRYQLTYNDYERALQVLQAHNIRYFFLAGGCHSMETAHRIAELAAQKGYELRVMGIPKTAENNLVSTDHCPGYGSAARWLAIAVKDAGRDTDALYTDEPIKVIETAGRSTGWIAAATALAKEEGSAAPHLIYLPERPLVEATFLADVQEVYERLDRAVIVAAEGAKNEAGETIAHVGAHLCHLIGEKLFLKARLDKPGSLQRVSQVCASRVDAEEALLVGRKAVSLAVDGYSGYLMTLVREAGATQYKSIVGTARLEEVGNKERPLPDEFINAQGNGVTEAFLEYARPLIGGPLPEYVALEKFSVEKRLEAHSV